MKNTRTDEKNIVYREERRDELAACSAQYYEQNKSDILEKMKISYDECKESALKYIIQRNDCDFVYFEKYAKEMIMKGPKKFNVQQVLTLLENG